MVQDNLFLINNQGIGVFKPIMHYMPIKLPRLPQKKMISTHKHQITKNIIYILLSNRKGGRGLFGCLNVATIIELFQIVGLGMRNNRNTKLLNKDSGGHVGATSFINSQVTNLILDGTA